MIGRVIAKIVSVIGKKNRGAVVEAPDVQIVIRSARRPSKPRARALLTYICDPFFDNVSAERIRSHANRSRAVAIADILASRGFEVDVTSWKNSRPPDGAAYDLIVGLGEAFSSAASTRREHVPALYLATGVSPVHFNNALLARRAEFEKRYDVSIKVNLLASSDGPSLANRIHLIGNDWTRSTYLGASPNLMDLGVNSVTPGVVADSSVKDFNVARRRFLWMAAYGPLLRRLDIVLEAFSQRPDLELWVCGGVHHDKDFYRVMRRLLTEIPNIHYAGWVDVGGERFKSIVNQCGYLLYPSVADGMPGSAVNAGACGVVPLVTKESGIDVAPFGDVIDGSTVEAILAAVDRASARSATELSNRAAASLEHFRSNYTLAEFGRRFCLSLDSLGVC